MQKRKRSSYFVTFRVWDFFLFYEGSIILLYFHKEVSEMLPVQGKKNKDNN